MAWQQSAFKSNWKVLAQNEEKDVRKENTQPANLEILQEELKKVWSQEMSTEYFKNLSDSMPKRLQMIIKNKGNMTKY